MDWREELVEKFQGRPEYTLDELASEFGVSSTETDELQACLNIFTEEYGIPYGKLRPDDGLDSFLQPAPTRNPVAEVYRRFAMEDSISELNYMLKKRRSKLGSELRQAPMSIGDYVTAWFAKETS